MAMKSAIDRSRGRRRPSTEADASAPLAARTVKSAHLGPVHLDDRHLGAGGLHAAHMTRAKQL